jgi:hypothetical protein
MELAHDERRERPVGLELSAEQDAAGFDPSEVQDVLKEPGGHVQHGGRLTRKRQHRGQALEPFDVALHCQMAGQPPRGRPKLGQVRRQPLLQLARPA